MTNYAVTPYSASYNQLLAVPSFGDLDGYTRAVNAVPMLTPEQEYGYAMAYRADPNNLQAAHALVVSHLRVVVSIARKYTGYGLPQADLIQEGSIGLMKAVKRFDPAHGVRLVSFAMHWIKAEIHEYVIKNWRMVKIATTKAQRKLFFNLRSMKTGEHMSQDEVHDMARVLKVKPEEVIEMDQRLTGRDIAIDGGMDSDDDAVAMAPIAYLAEESNEPTQVLARAQKDILESEGLDAALAVLDERSRAIVAARWLADDEGKGQTLHELAAQFGVSAERIRQIETAAMKKMRLYLTEQYAA
ncbi:RNA polymerase sigma factor RpoH [Formosimonas limnophila]|uniref:RNA polymerase sigma factor n=1 Tax=Formosimonas limnophila TaxID=1384487 RepID=A0A8J3CMW6_9BURK|nr:RNA polymerase sigma factor RpoH [Formosimonas limnophila]GHA72647.1 RNA polymerase sigma factor RpoH [Formosimonas limnophila]